MKAVFIQQYGGNDVLQYGDVVKPALGGPDHVMVRIHAASINPLDYRMRSGLTRIVLNYALPMILGHDCSGTVTQVGNKVTKFKVGDEVFGRVPDFHIGTLSEYISVHDSALEKKPVSISHEEAAAVPMVGLTAMQALKMANVGQGTRVFIPAGAGGVGSFAIQVAKILGAYVATTCSEGKKALCSELGADVIVDYTKQDYTSILHNYDVALDILYDGHKMFKTLKPGGWCVGIGTVPDSDVAPLLGLSRFLALVLDTMNTPLKSLAWLHGINYQYLWMQPNSDMLSLLSNWIDQGKIQPVIDSVYPLSEARQAFARLESGRVAGKVVIRIVQ